MMSTPPATGFAARLAGVGLVVFLANAGLLVLQLVAGKLLSPFVGSSLSTWTVVIAAFLTGIAFGNAIGGRLADRLATPGRLVRFLLSGALAALWMIAFPEILERTGVHRGLELDIRIPVLAFALCFPAGFTLSLLTPMAIRICVPDVGRAGSVSGLVFSLGTLGCLLGNYLTGFELIPNLELNWIVAAVAGLLVVTAAAAYAVVRNHPPAPTADAPTPAPVAGSTAAQPLPLGLAFAIVFACSFAGMSLELSAVRLLAQVLGVSLFTWTGVIGVMLAGTALGNLVGGRLADRAGRSIAPNRRAEYLGWSLVFCGITTVLVILLFIILNQVSVLAVESVDGAMQASFSAVGIIERVILWTFSLFFLPMFGLGLISPQVIRLAVPDVGSVGRVAGSIYAWSIGGAIAGTFATGYLLISSLGVNNTILLAAALPCAVLLLVRVAKPQPAGAAPGPRKSAPLVLESGVMLYALSASLGAVFGGFVLSNKESSGITLETNYYTIRVSKGLVLIPPSEPLQAVAGVNLDPQRRIYLDLVLDNLRHSQVQLDDPTFLHYKHEHFQLEMVRHFKEITPEKQSVLVIGGGGYTFPRCVRVLIPTASVDVVEIDPGVTRVAKLKLGLIDDWKIRSIHMDGRQFVAEKSQPGTYDLVTLDAVNDLSVPSHLMTKEFNAAVQKTLTPNGVYLVTVIDFVETGKLWKAAANTLRETFQHVELVFPVGQFDDDRPGLAPRSVIVLYASNAPLDGDKLRAAVVKQTGEEPITHIVGRETLDLLLSYDQDTKEKLWRKLSPDERARFDALVQEMDEHARLKGTLRTLRDDREKLEAQKGAIEDAGRLKELAKLDRQEEGLPERIAASKGKWADWIRLVNETAQAKNIGPAKKIILTDQFCPTDNLMIQVFENK